MTYQPPEQQDTSEQSAPPEDLSRETGETLLNEVDWQSASGTQDNQRQPNREQTTSELTFGSSIYGDNLGLNGQEGSEGSGTRAPGSSTNPADRIGDQEAGAEPPAGTDPGRRDSETPPPERQTGRAPGEGLDLLRLAGGPSMGDVRIPTGNFEGLPYDMVTGGIWGGDEQDYQESQADRIDKANDDLNNQAALTINQSQQYAAVAMQEVGKGNTNPGVDLAGALSSLSALRSELLGAAGSDPSVLSKLSEVSSAEGSVSAAKAKLDLAKVAVANGVDSGQLTHYFNLMSSGHSRESAIKFAGSRSENV